MGRRVKILSLGDLPDFSTFESSIAAFEAVGFDGWVLAPTFGSGTQIYGVMWGTSTTIPWGSISTLWSSLIIPPATAPIYNFLRADVTPGDVDWFAAGMATISNNFVQLAKLARDSFCQGIFFDTEPYQGQVWNYSLQPQVGSHTYNQYKTQVYNIALAMGLAMWAEFPSCQFMVTGSYWNMVAAGGSDSDKAYGLFPSFLDGLLDSMATYPCAQLIIGNELSYLCNSNNNCFNSTLAEVYAPPYTGSSAQFYRHASISMPIWLTTPNGMTAFNNTVTSGNYNTPTGGTSAIVLAAQYSNQYVWVYTGNYGWVEPVPSILSSDYANTILNALPLLP